MHHNLPHDISPTGDANFGQWRNPGNNTFSASTRWQDGTRGARDEDTRDGLNDRLQWTPNVIVDPHCIDGSGLQNAAHGAVSDPSGMPRSDETRMAAMRMAFAGSGGLLTVGELADGNGPDSRARFAHIAKGIATREIIGFMWQSEPWVPMFQFDAGSDLLPRQALQPLFRLLAPLYDPWEMANWFARSNPWLSGLRPVDQCAAHLQAVLDVAHLEHFIATGQTPEQHSEAPHTTCN